MRRTLRVVVGAIAVTLAFTAAPAFAGNGHFIANHTKASLSGSDLDVKFKEAGLESGSTVSITATADFTGTYQCVNRGGHNPNDPKKTTTGGEVSDSGEFTVGRNGSVSGTLTLSPLAAPADFTCPAGQQMLLTEWSYTNVQIEDLDTDAQLDLGGPFSGGARVS